MARDSEYEAIRNKLNLKTAENQALRESYQEEKKAWAKTAEKNKIMEDNARDLCKMILAKDRTESRTGGEYTWNNIKTLELINKAKESYVNDSRAKAIHYGETVDLAEARGRQIESLIEQITAYLVQSGLEGEDLEKALIDVQNGEKINQVIKTLPKNILNAAEKGDVTLRVIDDDELSQEERGIMESTAEMKYVEEYNAVNIQPKNKKKRIEQKQGIKDTTGTKIHVQNLEDTEASMGDVHWYIIEEFGTTGASRWTEVKDSVIAKHPDISANKSNTALKELKLANIVKGEKISTPIAKLQWLYKLTDGGIRLFRDHFSMDPVSPEMERVKAEHDNYEHGYGILETASVLESKNFYDSVNAYNRDHPIKLSKNRLYIPDITCQIKKRTDYYEYERGHHTQPDFNDKCNKMVLVSRFLTFIVPNKETVKSINTQIAKWIETVQENLPNVKIRIATVDSLRSGNITDDSAWLVIYNLGSSTEPMKMPDWLK